MEPYDHHSRLFGVGDFMELTTAIALIERGVRSSEAGAWADLGAGDGLFTRALATLLFEGSVINAVDKNLGAMKSLVLPSSQIKLNKIGSDFERLNFDHLDGVLMANSLHFIKDQQAFLTRLRGILKPSGQLVVVEYNSDKGNMWVPYPISFEKLKSKVIDAGFRGAVRLHEVPSRFGRANIYGARIEF